MRAYCDVVYCEEIAMLSGKKVRLCEMDAVTSCCNSCRLSICKGGRQRQPALNALNCYQMKGLLELIEQSSKLKQEVEDLKNEVSELKNEVTDLNDVNMELRDVNKGLKAEIKELKDKQGKSMMTE
jgi:septal ring factor EnvC (AmiA/AmiB activator)